MTSLIDCPTRNFKLKPTTLHSQMAFRLLLLLLPFVSAKAAGSGAEGGIAAGECLSSTDSPATNPPSPLQKPLPKILTANKLDLVSLPHPKNTFPIEGYCTTCQRALRLAKRASLSAEQFQFIVQSLEGEKWNYFQTVIIFDHLLRMGHWKRMGEFSTIAPRFIGNGKACRILKAISPHFTPDSEWNCSESLLESDDDYSVSLLPNSTIYRLKQPHREDYWNYKLDIHSTIFFCTDEEKPRIQQILHCEPQTFTTLHARIHSFEREEIFTVHIQKDDESEIFLNALASTLPQSFAGGQDLKETKISGWGTFIRIGQWTFTGPLNCLKPSIEDTQAHSTPIHITSEEQGLAFQLHTFKRSIPEANCTINYTLAKEYSSISHWTLGPFYRQVWTLAYEDYPVMHKPLVDSKPLFGVYYPPALWPISRSINGLWAICTISHRGLQFIDQSFHAVLRHEIDWDNLALLWTLCHIWVMEIRGEVYLLNLKEDAPIFWHFDGHSATGLELKVVLRRGKQFLAGGGQRDLEAFQEFVIKPEECVPVEGRRNWNLQTVETVSAIVNRWVYTDNPVKT